MICFWLFTKRLSRSDRNNGNLREHQEGLKHSYVCMQVVAAYAASMNGGSTPASTDAAQAPLVMGTSGPDVLTQAVAAAPVGASAQVPSTIPIF